MSCVLTNIDYHTSGTDQVDELLRQFVVKDAEEHEAEAGRAECEAERHERVQRQRLHLPPI